MVSKVAEHTGIKRNTALVQFLLPIKKSGNEKSAEAITDFLLGGFTEKREKDAWHLVNVLPARPTATYLTVENTGRDGYYREKEEFVCIKVP